MNDRTSLNVAVIRGTVRGGPVLRTLPSDSVIVQFDVAVTGSRGAMSVPVAWVDPSSGAGVVDDGADVVVVGRVQRRFFRVGGVTQSRTELIADRVIPARRRKQVAAALDDVTSRLAG